MRAEIEKLLRVQELDAEAHKIGKELERYPELRRARADEAARTEKKLEAAKSKRRDIELQIREAERNAAKWREDLQKFSQQQERVKNQKEYDALTHEISETEKKISDEEEKGLERVFEEDRLDGEMAELEKTLERQTAELEKEIARLNERESEKKRFLEEIRDARVRETAGIDPDALKRYERLRDQYPVNAIAPVQDGNCGGCFMRVLPRTLQDLQRNDSLAECVSCHRILYVP